MPSLAGHGAAYRKEDSVTGRAGESFRKDSIQNEMLELFFRERFWIDLLQERRIGMRFFPIG